MSENEGISPGAATLRFTSEDEKLTREGFESLAATGKLGAVVAQFPISFKNTEQNRAYLRKLIAMFREYPLAIEVRHSGWNDPSLSREFSALGVGFVNIDQPLLGRAMRGTAHVTGSIAMCECTAATTNSGLRRKGLKIDTTSSIDRINSNLEGAR
jgi:uncharacterized protein YecE (DUF72 family)